MTDHTQFHEWLRGCLPARASEIMAECQLSHKAGIGQGLPADAVQLMVALRNLERDKLAEKRADELWYWRAEQPKPEPQGVLF